MYIEWDEEEEEESGRCLLAYIVRYIYIYKYMHASRFCVDIVQA